MRSEHEDTDQPDTDQQAPIEGEQAPYFVHIFIACFQEDPKNIEVSHVTSAILVFPGHKGQTERHRGQSKWLGQVFGSTRIKPFVLTLPVCVGTQCDD